MRKQTRNYYEKCWEFFIECTGCLQYKHVDDFYKMKKWFMWRMSQCKECRKLYEYDQYHFDIEASRTYRKKYYKKNKDRILSTTKEWRDRNKDLLNKKAREYYSKNRERFIKSSTRWKKNHKEQYNEYQRQYYIKNRERIIDCTNKWVENNRDKHNEYQKQYREKNKSKVLVGNE